MNTRTGKLTSNSDEMAEILQQQYKSLFSQPSTNQEKVFPERQGITTICDFEFTISDIEKEIDTLSSDSAPGPDGTPAVLLKNCKSSLAVPIYLHWRKSLDETSTPKLHKTSIITPIYKGDDQGDPVNYRPVALTSHIVKVFEKVVRRKLVAHLEGNNLFNSNQHGFRGGRSCLSQLLAHVDTVLSYLEQGYNVDTIYLDFSKAFDKVDHTLLLKKLQNYGIHGKLLGWIKSFLTGRLQYVIVNSHLSNPTVVLSGVPQGSVLGPLLFLIMISDIDDDVKFSVLSSFADDTRLVKAIGDTMDNFKLQHDMNKVYDWTKDNNMKLNGKKFEQLSYGRHSVLKKNSIYLTDSSTKVKKTNLVRDLGVTITDDGRFSKHIDQVVKKATELSSLVLKAFKSRKKNSNAKTVEISGHSSSRLLFPDMVTNKASRCP